MFNLVFEGNYELQGTAIYFAEKKFIFRRVSILENLCPALSREGMTPISVEISLEPNTKPTDSNEQLKVVLEQLASIPQFGQLDSLIAHEILEVDFAYPMQNNGLRDFVTDIHAVYKDAGVYHCGRGGNFDYCNSDVAYEQGKQTVDQAFASIG